MSRTLTSIVAGLCVLAGAAWVWNSQNVPSDNDVDYDTLGVVDENPSSTSGNTVEKSPFALSEESDNSAVDAAGDVIALNPEAADTIQVSQAQSNEPVDVTQLGREPLSDADFLLLAGRLRTDPALLQQLIDEFRQETDKKRLTALSRLLGEVGGAKVTLTASELIYSGDAENRRIGLELLQLVQPGNAEARNIASTLLATEVEPVILVDTLTTLAKPGTVDDTSRRFLSDQVAFLADHESARVRSISLNILSRWDKDGEYTHVIQEGLGDQEPVVRESAVYAFVGQGNADQSVIDSLIAVAVNSQEEKAVRSGAILALKGMSLSDYEREQVARAEVEISIIRR